MTSRGSGGLLRKRVAVFAIVSMVASLLTLAAADPASAAGTNVVTLTLKASPGLIQWDQRAKVSGKLSFPDLTTTNGESVTLSVTPPGGVKTQISVIALTAAGTFSINSSRLRTAGTYTFTADYAGNSMEEAAATDATTVLTVLKLSKSARTVDFKKRVILTVHLDNYKQTTKHRVALWDAPYPKTTFTQVASAKVKTKGKGKGDATFVMRPGKLTAFIASWLVISPEAVASNIVWVRVRSKVVPYLALFLGQPGFRGRSGPYYDFSQMPCVLHNNYWSGCLSLYVKLLPNRGGSTLCFVNQHLTPKGWKTDRTPCDLVNMRSHAGVDLVAEKAGIQRRVMGYYKGDKRVLGSRSQWIYYEFFPISGG